MIFAFMITILLGMSAFVVDMAWIWSNQLQVQRAADAGALAGVVHLPAEPDDAEAAAKAEARKNGFTDDLDGVDVVAMQDPGFNRRMIVSVSAPVDTFFMGLFGYSEVTVSRSARAEYVLPVPMGSPQNYYGVGVLRIPVTTTSTSTDADHETDWRVPANVTCPTSPSNHCQWTASSGTLPETVRSNNNVYAQTATNGRVHQWIQLRADRDGPAAVAGRQPDAHHHRHPGPPQRRLRDRRVRELAHRRAAVVEQRHHLVPDRDRRGCPDRQPDDHHHHRLHDPDDRGADAVDGPHLGA